MDLAVVFHGLRHLAVVRDDDTPLATYEALDKCIGHQHEVLFFYVDVLSEPSQPATSHVPAPPRDAVWEEKMHLDEAYWKVGIDASSVAPVPFPLVICGFKLAEGFRGEVLFCFFLV